MGCFHRRWSGTGVDLQGVLGVFVQGYQSVLNVRKFKFSWQISRSSLHGKSWSCVLITVKLVS